MTAEQITNIIFPLIGGLGLFLYGMNSLSSGLQKSSAEKLKKAIEKLTTNRVMGTAVGAVVTMVVQSSSVTTVMVVGLVNASLMTLPQSLSVILGANVGTTITAQIIAFKVTAFALPMIGVGAVLLMFVKKSKIKYFGEILFGLGLLFFGMGIMTDAFMPLSKSEAFKEFFVTFSKHTTLAILVGAATTFVVQSSSLTLGITIALASTGLIDFQAAAALVLGENIGTTITANIAALNASRRAKQAALGHFLINMIGVTYIFILFTPFIKFIDFITPDDPNFVAANGTQPYIARHIANAHTIFNIINTFIFLPFIPLLAKLCQKIIPEKQEDTETKILQLSNSIMSSPEIAVGLVRNEVMKMFDLSFKILNLTDGKYNYQKKISPDILKKNLSNLTILHSELKSFIERLQTKSLSIESETSLINISHQIEEIYQLGIRSYKFLRLNNKIPTNKVVFSKTALKELEILFDTVYQLTGEIVTSFKSSNIDIEHILTIEDLIDSKRKEYKNNHIKRLYKGKCSFENGLVFIDMINTLEKIADNSYNLTQLLVNKK